MLLMQKYLLSGGDLYAVQFEHEVLSIYSCYFPLSLQPSFAIFLNTQQLAGRMPAEWALIAVAELRVSFVTVTVNLPGVQSWDREQEGELHLIA